MSYHTNPDRRPLPPGFESHYDRNYNTWFYVDTRYSPATSSWIHPLGRPANIQRASESYNGWASTQSYLPSVSSYTSTPTTFQAQYTTHSPQQTYWPSVEYSNVTKPIALPTPYTTHHPQRQSGIQQINFNYSLLHSNLANAFPRPTDPNSPIQAAHHGSPITRVQLRHSENAQTRVEVLDWSDFVRPNLYVTVGGGGFADVYRGEWRERVQKYIEAQFRSEPPPVAIKKFRVAEAQLQVSQFLTLRKQIIREVAIWQNLDHENIVPFLGICQNNDGLPHLVSEWMTNGVITRYIDFHPATCLRKMLEGVASGLNYLHGQNIVHGDMKSLNVLVNRKGQPCLCDFGLSRILVETSLWLSEGSHAKGTLRWQAPELLNQEQRSPTVEADVYAYGMTCYEIITNNVPFYHLNEPQVILAVCFSKQMITRPECSCMTDDVWELLRRCWSSQPDARPKMPCILSKLSIHSCSKDRDECLFRDSSE